MNISLFLDFQNYKDIYEDFSDGLPLLSNKRDKADFEWETIYYLLHTFFPWVIAYLFISEIIRMLLLGIKVLQLWQIFFTVVYIEAQLGHVFLCIILFQPVIYYLTNTISKNTLFTWTCTGISLISITYYKKLSETKNFHEFINLKQYELYISTLSLFWLNLKCSSYCLEKQEKIRVLDFLSYCLYLPTMFTGPFIPYKDFCSIYRTAEYLPIKKRITNFVINVSKTVFWFLFGNFYLHFVYVNATSFHPKLVKTFSTWSLNGYGYAMGQHFHIKYIVLYGLSTTWASFENVNVPHLPRCIGRIHLYSDMWKYFDRGLYKYLVRHIYIPTMKIVPYKFLASLLCFLFVYIWHGVETYILIWSLLNYFGVCLEYMCASLKHKYFGMTKYSKAPDGQWFRRFKCLLTAPLLALSAISNFYFLLAPRLETPSF